MRRQLSRLGLDKNFVAILTASFSLVVLLGFVVLGLNLGGLPIPWEAKVPGIGLSLSQIFRLIVLVAIVFWFASAAKRFLFNRFLSKSGLDRALQYTIAQICGYLVLVVGVLVALQSAGLNLSALAVFAGAVGVGIGFGLQTSRATSSADWSCSQSDRSTGATTIRGCAFASRSASRSTAM